MAIEAIYAKAVNEHGLQGLHIISICTSLWFSFKARIVGTSSLSFCLVKVASRLIIMPIIQVVVFKQLFHHVIRRLLVDFNPQLGKEHKG